MPIPLRSLDRPLPFDPKTILTDTFKFAWLHRSRSLPPQPLTMVVNVAAVYGVLDESFYQKIVEWYHAGYRQERS